MKHKIITYTLKSLFILFFAMLIGKTVWAQSSITAIGTAVTQNFKGLTTSTSYQTWTDNSTLTGWYTKTDVTSPYQYKANPGGNTAVSLNSFNSTGTVNNILRLKITTDNLMNDYENMSDETVIRFVDGATSNFDGNFDAYKLFGLKEYPQLYTLTTEGKRVSINAYSDANIDSTKVQMNLRIGLRGYYKITATGMESFDNAAYIALEDTKYNITQILTDNPIYSLYGDTSDYEGRFIVWFYPKSINRPNEIGNLSHNDVNIYSNHKTIFINLNGMNANELTIMNMFGQTVDKKQITSNQQSSFETELTTGFYIVRILVDGKFFDKKLYLEE